ncbi:hypothetical protein PAJ34TS1_30260 [Paenibacillus azoreducens]
MLKHRCRAKTGIPYSPYHLSEVFTCIFYLKKNKANGTTEFFSFELIKREEVVSLFDVTRLNEAIIYDTNLIFLDRLI